MLVWMTLSAASKRGFANACCFFREGYHESRLACVKSALLVKETMLKIKINKLMNFTVSVLAAICFCHGRRLVGLRYRSYQRRSKSGCKTVHVLLITRYHLIFVHSFVILGAAVFV